MRALGPFEARPRIAVAVSGGPDSLALALLAADWAVTRGGSAHALTVDHGLRPEAAAEAAWVGQVLAARRIGHAVLRWEGPHPRTGVQAAARKARYDLLTGWCAANGVLHLLLAHHRDDQAETVLLRLTRGSGAYGLAGMASVLELPSVRLLRPLLGVSGACLRETLAAHGLAGIADPSNRDPAFARARLRAAMPALAGEGLTATRIAETARSLGHARVALEAAVGAAIAETVRLHPAGFARLDATALGAHPAEVGLRTLAAVLACVGGLAYAPRRARLERAWTALFGNAEQRPAATLGGCRLVPMRGGGMLVCREPAAATEATPIGSGETVLWDDRFRVRLGAEDEPGTVRRLGAEGWRRIVAARPELRSGPVPPPARPALPAIWDGAGVRAAPQLGYVRPGANSRAAAAFAPMQPLCGPGFMLV